MRCSFSSSHYDFQSYWCSSSLSSRIPADPAFLSDARWIKAEVGWGEVVRNRYSFNQGQWEGLLLKIDDQVFGKGLYGHSDSTFIFPLGGNWKTFTATCGLQDGAGRQGSAIFTLIGDGKELYQSAILRSGQKETLQVDLTDIQPLELRTQGGEGHNYHSWAIWADPQVGR